MGVTVSDPRSADARRALGQAVMLCVLVAWAFRDEGMKVVEQATTMVQASHMLVVPLLLVLLVYQRREALVAALRRGSIWGVVLLGAAVATYALATWPFYVGYVRRLQFVVAFAGIVLAVAGWRVLWRCMPLVLIVGLAIPVGWNTFAALIIRPETLTLDAAAALLDLVPGAMVELRGQDLQFVRAGARGVIALGDPHRGFAAPVALLAVGLYVVYACVRPLWQTAVLLALVVPLVALGNLVRVVVHGLVTMWTHASPTDGSPRDVALVASLVLTYFAMGALAAVLARLFVNADDGLTTATE